MTPADELTAAADKLDALIAEATDGPWRDMPMGSEGSTILAGGNTVSTSRRVGRTGEFADAEYIAAVNPLVGKVLAAWLREMATGNFIGWDGRALDIARLINGGAS